MIKITQEDKTFFSNHGWVSVSSGMSERSVKETYTALQLMRNNAINHKYPLGTVWVDRLRKFNLAGIEAPFNDQIIRERNQRTFSRNWSRQSG